MALGDTVVISRAAFRKASELGMHNKHGLRASDALYLGVALGIGAKSIATLLGAVKGESSAPRASNTRVPCAFPLFLVRGVSTTTVAR